MSENQSYCKQYIKLVHIVIEYILQVYGSTYIHYSRWIILCFVCVYGWQKL